MLTVYGIANCDTMKKARHWLDEHGIAYTFHDYKKLGLEEAVLRGWVAKLGWEALMNRRGMMWRKLDEQTRNSMNESSAINIMLEIPSIIRRPVLVTDNDRIIIGFDEEQYRKLID